MQNQNFKQTDYKIDPTTLNLPSANGTANPGTFTYLKEPSDSSVVTHEQEVYAPKILNFEFDDNVKIDFGPGLHVILGPANTGKSALIKSMTDKLDEDDYSQVEYMEPVLDSHLTAQAAFDESLTKQIIFFDSLRAFTFMGGSSLAGGISSNIPLILTELTQYALRRNIVLFVTLNTIDTKMTELLANVAEGSATSVLRPHTIIGNDLERVQISVDFNSRYYLRRTIHFITSFTLDHETTPLGQWFIEKEEPVSNRCLTDKVQEVYKVISPDCSIADNTSNDILNRNFNN